MSNSNENKQKVAEVFKSLMDLKNIDILLDRYEEMQNEFLLNNYETVLVKVGKFIEEFYQFLDYLVRKNIASKPNLEKIRDRLDNAIKAQKIPSSLKSLVADSLHIAYRFRNSRDGAHSTVDFIANKIDAKFTIDISKWCIAEIIRLYSSLNTEGCLSIINGIMQEPIPHIEKFDDEILVLHDFSATYEILTILLFSKNNKKPEKFLKSGIRHHSAANISTSLRNLEKKRYIFRTDGICILTKLGKKEIIEFLRKI